MSKPRKPKQTPLQRDIAYALDVDYDPPWLKRLMRRIAREAVAKFARDLDTLIYFDPTDADRIARELVP